LCQAVSGCPAQQAVPQPERTESPAMLTQIVHKFEEAHQSGAEPRVQDFVPPDAADRMAAAAELVRIDLEYRRKRGLPVRVDAYLTPFPGLTRDDELMLDVIAAEFHARWNTGENPALETYAGRFPALAERLGVLLPARTVSSVGLPGV